MKKKLRVSKGMRLIIMAVTIVVLLVIGSDVYRLATSESISFKRPLVASAEIQMPYIPTPNDLMSAEAAHEEMKTKILQAAITEAKEQARLVEEAEKLAEEVRLAEEEKLAKEAQLTEEIRLEEEARVATTTDASITNTETAVQTQTPEQTQTETQTETATTTAPPAQTTTPTPPPAPAAPSAIGPNNIGIAGIYKSYVSYGYADTATLQAGIDKGQVVSGLTYFDAYDGQTTYFAGHNPGVMNWMSQHLYVGAIVTVTDSSGEAFQYKMIDYAITNVAGQDKLTSIGQSAVSVYAFGSSQESIAIQYCVTGDTDMIFWYGVKI